MLGRSRRNEGKGAPKELPPAAKQDLVAGKLEEVLARVEEINRFLTEALNAEYASYQALAAKQEIIAKVKRNLAEAGKEMSRISEASIPKSESQPPAAPKELPPVVENPSLERAQHKGLGEMLIEQGIITQSQLAEAEARQKERGGYLGQILVEMGFVKQDTVVYHLVKQCKIPHLSLLDYNIEKEVLELVPQEICRRRKLLPIDKLGRILTIAMCDPLDTEALEEIRKLHPELRLKPILCNWQHFKTVSARLFGAEDEKSEPSESPAPASETAASNSPAPDPVMEMILESEPAESCAPAPDLKTAPREPSDGAAAPPISAPAGATSRPKSLGEALVTEGLITEHQLAEALIKQAESGFLGRILVEMRFIEQDALVQFLVKQCKIPHLSLLDYEISKDVLEIVPKEICLRHSLLPIDKLGRTLTLAMCDPLDAEALEEIRKAHPDLRFKLVLCLWQHFKTVSARLFEDAAEESKPDAEFYPRAFGLNRRAKGKAPGAEKP